MSMIRDQTEKLKVFNVKLYENELMDLLLLLMESDSGEAYYLYDILYDAWMKG